MLRASVCGVVLVRFWGALRAVVNVLRPRLHERPSSHVLGRRSAESMLAERHGDRSKALQWKPQDHECGQNESPPLHGYSIALPTTIERALPDRLARCYQFDSLTSPDYVAR